MKATVKSPQFNQITKSIKAANSSLDSYLTDFRAAWRKVFPAQAREALTELQLQIKEEPNNMALKELRHSYEIASAKAKSLQLTAEDVASIKAIFVDCGLGYKQITLEYIVESLKDTRYIVNGELVEYKKIDGVQTPVPVQRWTLNKVGRFLRLSYNCRCAKIEVAKVVARIKRNGRR